MKKKGKNGKAAAGGKAAKAEASEAKMAKAPKPGKAAEAKVRMGKAEAEVKALAEKAPVAVAEAKDAYRIALAPYREACTNGSDLPAATRYDSLRFSHFLPKPLLSSFSRATASARVLKNSL